MQNRLTVEMPFQLKTRVDPTCQTLEVVKIPHENGHFSVGICAQHTDKQCLRGETHNPSQTAAKFGDLCPFFGRDSELQMYHGNF